MTGMDITKAPHSPSRPIYTREQSEHPRSGATEPVTGHF